MRSLHSVVFVRSDVSFSLGFVSVMWIYGIIIIRQDAVGHRMKAK